MMRLTFIGTSHGVPEPHRRCSSNLLEVNGAYYIIDMGTQTIEELRRLGIRIEDVRLVICTHPHGDHTNGLVSFVDLVNWYYKKASPLILLPDENMIAPLKAWNEATEGYAVALVEAMSQAHHVRLPGTDKRDAFLKPSGCFLRRGDDGAVVLKKEYDIPGKRLCAGVHPAPDAKVARIAGAFHAEFRGEGPVGVGDFVEEDLELVGAVGKARARI